MDDEQLPDSLRICSFELCLAMMKPMSASDLVFKALTSERDMKKAHLPNSGPQCVRRRMCEVIKVIVLCIQVPCQGFLIYLYKQ